MSAPKLYDTVTIRGVLHTVVQDNNEPHIGGWKLLLVENVETRHRWVAYDKEMIVVERKERSVI